MAQIDNNPIQIGTMLLPLMISIFCAARGFPNRQIQLNSIQGNLTSPGFPDRYPHNLDVSWKLDVQSVLNFTLTLNIWMENSLSCKADRLSITDVSDTNVNILNTCGQWNTSTNTTIHFIGYGFVVKFTTDHSVTDKGFLFTYDTSPADMDYICGMMETERTIATEASGLSSRYPASINCTWIIKAPVDEFIIIKFLYFDIEFSGDSCDADRLEIWIQTEDPPTRNKTLCGRRNGWSFAWNTSSISILFVSDDRDSVGGFLLQYETRPSHSLRSYSPLQMADSYVNLANLCTALPFSGLRDDLRSGSWIIRTNPGFNIKLLNDQDLSGGLTFYDGPITDYYTSPKINIGRQNIPIITEGFILAIIFHPVAYTAHKNITFQAIHGFTDRRQIFNIIGKTSMFLGPTNTASCCKYIQAVGPVSKSPKISFGFNVDVFQSLPNYDKCLYGGIALYNGYISLTNMIGPFCDISDSYTEYVVKNFVGSSSIFYILYSYGESSIDATIVLSSVSDCSAYYVIPQHRNELFQQTGFEMIINQIDNEMTIQIDFEEGQGHCVVVYFVPELWNLTRMTLSLRGELRYRVCRVSSRITSTKTIYSAHESKYSSSESCTNISYVSNETTVIENILDVTGKWSNEMSRLDLGSFEEKLCPDKTTCPHEGWNIMSDSCGVLWTHDCIWYLQLPRTKDSTKLSWYIRINGIYGNPDETRLKISEYLFNDTLVLETNVWIRDIGYQVVFDYRSIHAADILLTPKDVDFIEIAFEIVPLVKPKTLTVSHDNTSCFMFGQKCYAMKNYSSPTSWVDARRACQEYSGDLVTVTNQEELEFLKLSLSTEWREIFYGKGPGLVYIGLDDQHKADDYRWSNGSPLSVSDWFYPFDPFNNVLPDYPVSPIDPSIIQPEVDDTKRCVAMVPGNPSLSTNWMKINCWEQFRKPVYSICEFSIRDEIKKSRPTILSENNTHHNTSRTLTDESISLCSKGWTSVLKRCLALLTGTIKLHESLTVSDAASLCRSYGGEMAVVQNVSENQLSQFLQMVGIGFGSGDIWIKGAYNMTDCISRTSLAREVSLGSKISQGSCHKSEGRVGHVLCESHDHIQSEKCQSYQFICEDMSCLSPDRICDSRKDCPSGKDELNCLPSQYYPCLDGSQVISVSKYCDFEVDCVDGSDEKDCSHVNCALGMFQCTNKQCIRTSKRCDHVVNCFDGSDEIGCQWDLQCLGYRCPISGCVPGAQVGDLHPDCPDKTQNDETLDNELSHKRYVFFMHYNGQLVEQYNADPECPLGVNYQRCNKQHSACYPRDKVCVYDHDKYDKLKYCRNGAHLLDCSTYHCPGMFKCSLSYCLPYHKVCDGVKDCPGGTDEMNCENHSCSHKLRCGQTSQCVSQDQICDGQRHCVSTWDDERFCLMRLIQCPTGCQCYGYVVICRAKRIAQVPSFNGMDSIRSLDLHNNSIVSVVRTDFQAWFYLTSLDLSVNLLSALERDNFFTLLNLVFLDLSYNQLSQIVPSTFENLSKLKRLILKGNPIHKLSDGSFLSLSSLRSVNLSGMIIRDLPDKTFLGLSSIESLDLSGNILERTGSSLQSINTSLRQLSLTNNSLKFEQLGGFDGFILRVLRTDFYRFCCLAHSTIEQCSPETDVYSSCSLLLASDISKTFIWVFAALILVVNGVILIWRLRAHIKTAHSVFAVNLCVANIFIGIYMFGLGLADQKYSGQYSLYDVQWRISWPCRALQIVAMTGWVKSLMTIECIAIERIIKVTRNPNSISFKMACLMEVISYIFVLFLVVYSYVNKPSEEITQLASICSPLNFTSRRFDQVHATPNVLYLYNCVTLCVIGFTLLFGYILKRRLYSTEKQKGKCLSRTGNADMLPVVALHMLSLLLIIIADTLVLLGFSLGGPTISIFSLFIFPLAALFGIVVFVFINLRSNKSMYA